MAPAGASVTALGAALMRSVHTRVSPSPLIDDPWGDRLVLEAERAIVLNVVLNGLSPQVKERCQKLGTPEAILDAALQAHPGYGWAVLRTRYAEDALAVAVTRGVGQYVIVGAGFDSFALRQPAFARDVDVFEIDHPATQALKRERLREYGVPVPPRLHFVPADLSQEQIGNALARSTFRFKSRVFFSWLGVTQYLSREANFATLRGIADCAESESQLVFTYLEEQALGTGTKSVGTLQEAFAGAREPWVSGFDSSRLSDELSEVGLRLTEDLDGLTIKRRYCRCPGNDFELLESSHIALAEVSPQSA